MTPRFDHSPSSTPVLPAGAARANFAAFLVLLSCAIVLTAASYVLARRRIASTVADRLAIATAWAKAELDLKEAKDQFTTTVSHELRTPLNAITASAALLADSPLNTEQRELVTLLETGAHQIVLVVDDVLSLNSLETGQFKVEYSKVNLKREVVEAAWNMMKMQPRCSERLPKLTLEKRIAPDVPAVIETDGARLRQVLAHLLLNAVKFTPDGGRVTLVVDTVRCRPQQPAWARRSTLGAGGGGRGGSSSGGVGLAAKIVGASSSFASADSSPPAASLRAINTGRSSAEVVVRAFPSSGGVLRRRRPLLLMQVDGGVERTIHAERRRTSCTPCS